MAEVVAVTEAAAVDLHVALVALAVVQAGDSGLGRWQALGWNLVSALATLPGALLGYFLLAEAQALIPYALALSAASFLYIAFGDLLPRIHGQTDRRQRQWQYLMLVLGMAGIALIRIHHG